MEDTQSIQASGASKPMQDDQKNRTDHPVGLGPWPEEPDREDGRWIDVVAREALDPDFPLALEVAGQPIGLYLYEGKVHALENICPHAHAVLTEGFQEGGLIECPLHSARFEIATGLGLDEIGQRNLVCHRVRVRDGRVEMLVNDEADAD